MIRPNGEFDDGTVKSAWNSFYTNLYNIIIFEWTNVTMSRDRVKMWVNMGPWFCSIKIWKIREIDDHFLGIVTERAFKLMLIGSRSQPIGAGNEIADLRIKILWNWKNLIFWQRYNLKARLRFSFAIFWSFFDFDKIFELVGSFLASFWCQPE